MTEEENDFLNIYSKSGKPIGLSARQHEVYGKLSPAALRAAIEKRNEDKPIIVPAKPALMQTPPRLTNAPAAKLEAKPASGPNADQPEYIPPGGPNTDQPTFKAPEVEKNPWGLPENKWNVGELPKYMTPVEAPDVITRASEIPKVGPPANVETPIQKMNPVGLTPPPANVETPIQKMNPVGLTPPPAKPESKPEKQKTSDVQKLKNDMDEVSVELRKNPDGNVIADILDAVGVGLSAYGGMNRQTQRQKKAEAELGTAQRAREIELQTAGQRSLQESAAKLGTAQRAREIELQTAGQRSLQESAAKKELENFLAKLEPETKALVARSVALLPTEIEKLRAARRYAVAPAGTSKDAADVVLGK